MEVWYIKPLENEDNLETVKKYINLLLTDHLICKNTEESNTPLGKFVKENPDMFYSPKRRSDNV